MYKYNDVNDTTITVNSSYNGERIEQKIERITNNREPITDGAPVIYTERKDGVRPEHNIRTDRFEIAIDAMDKVTGSTRAKRENYVKAVEAGPDDKSGGGSGASNIQATTPEG